MAEYGRHGCLVGVHIWVFPKIGVPQNGWFIMENPIKMHDLGGTTIFGNIHNIRFVILIFYGSNCPLRPPAREQPREHPQLRFPPGFTVAPSLANSETLKKPNPKQPSLANGLFHPHLSFIQLFWGWWFQFNPSRKICATSNQMNMKPKGSGFFLIKNIWVATEKNTGLLTNSLGPNSLDFVGFHGPNIRTEGVFAPGYWAGPMGFLWDSCGMCNPYVFTCVHVHNFVSTYIPETNFWSENFVCKEKHVLQIQTRNCSQNSIY